MEAEGKKTEGGLESQFRVEVGDLSSELKMSIFDFVAELRWRDNRDVILEDVWMSNAFHDFKVYRGTKIILESLKRMGANIEEVMIQRPSLGIVESYSGYVATFN